MNNHVPTFVQYIAENKDVMLTIPTSEEGVEVLTGYKIRADKFVEFVPTEELLKFREFDRRETPKHSEDDSHETIERFKKEFLKTGIEEPLEITYYAKNKMVLLTDGNHRLSAAVELSMPYLPVVVVSTDEPIDESKKYKAIPVPGYSDDVSIEVPDVVKPSDIGLPVVY